LAFGYSNNSPFVFYSLFNKDRKLILKMDIPISTPRMLHDFVITENHVIIPDLPMEDDATKVIRGITPWLWNFNKDGACRYGIMKRLN
jgi:9-cis-epoxycarotenoid dioxygenase